MIPSREEAVELAEMNVEQGGRPIFPLDRSYVNGVGWCILS